MGGRKEVCAGVARAHASVVASATSSFTFLARRSSSCWSLPLLLSARLGSFESHVLHDLGDLVEALATIATRRLVRLDRQVERHAHTEEDRLKTRGKRREDRSTRAVSQSASRSVARQSSVAAASASHRVFRPYQSNAHEAQQQYAIQFRRVLARFQLAVARRRRAVVVERLEVDDGDGDGDEEVDRQKDDKALHRGRVVLYCAPETLDAEDDTEDGLDDRDDAAARQGDERTGDLTEKRTRTSRKRMRKETKIDKSNLSPTCCVEGCGVTRALRFV